MKLTVLFVVGIFGLGNSEDIGEGSEKSSGLNVTDDTFEAHTVIGEICQSSFKYCKCKADVVDCDLTGFPGSMANRSLVHFHGQSISHTVKRVCLCNTPYHVKVMLDENLLPHGNFIHRVDIFNLTGPLNIQGAFRNDFNGDLYMSYVNWWENLHSAEFGRGNDMKVEGVESIQCCSTIKSSQVYNKPTLFMDTVQINDIHGNGLGGLHLWKSVILNYLKVENIHPLGISIANVPDIRITESVFVNVNSSGIRLLTFENLLFARNYIGYSHHNVFTAKSSRPNSVILNLENYFDFPYFWSLDARHIINWLNRYLEWDEYTFQSFRITKFSERKVSVEYNTVRMNFINGSFALPPVNGEDPVFNENILGPCNCTLMLDPQVNIPHIFESSRCSIRLVTKNNESCWINYKRVVDECKKGSVDENAYFKLCQDSSVSVLHKGEIKPVVSTKEIKNRFFEEMLKTVEFDDFQMSRILFTEGTPRSKSSQQVVSSDHISPRVAGYILGSSLIGVAVGIGIIVLIRKRRRNRMYREPVGGSFDLLTAEI